MKVAFIGDTFTAKITETITVDGESGLSVIMSEIAEELQDLSNGFVRIRKGQEATEEGA